MRDWLAAHCRLRVIANGKNCVAYGYAGVAGVPARSAWDGSRFTDKQNRHCRLDQKWSKGRRGHVFLSRDIVRSGAYRGTRGSELLEQELLKRLANAKFVPAIHNHQPVIAIFYGTVTFAVVNGKPRLRIFSNQQLDELKKENDFIDPQPYVGQDSKFTGIRYPDTGTTVQLTGVAELALNVDAGGNLKSMQVVSEEPPYLGFGQAAISDFSGAKFIPAFRDGKPVESKVTISVYYKP